MEPKVAVECASHYNEAGISAQNWTVCAPRAHALPGDNMVWDHPVFVPAYAKINLTLEVIGRRGDGYHELASVMQTISLYDTLSLRPGAGAEQTLVCDVAELAGADNLALRAAAALARASERERGVALELRKEIPAQGGLGGGSSDAAVTLMALERLWGVRLAAGELAALAASLGSDVPFFLEGGTALVTGRGEQVEALPDADPFWVVLAKPPVTISTARAFGALTPSDYADGAASAEVAETVRRGAPVPLGRLVNSFEASVLREFAPVARTRAALVAAGAPVVRLSGSGPTLFAPFPSLAPAAEVWRRMVAEGHAVWLVRSVPRAEVMRSLPPARADVVN